MGIAHGAQSAWRIGRVARPAGLALLLAAHALSAQDVKPASAAPTAAPLSARNGAQDANKVAAQPEAEPKQPKEPPKRAPHVALILPTQSKTFGKLADAVQSGFIAAAKAAGLEALPYRIYAVDDDNAALAREARRALNEAALLIVGGITRDGALVLAREVSLIPVLALNAPALAEADLPDRFHFISLSIDAEARLAARRAGEEGLKRVVVASSGAPLARRIQESFEREWVRRGGEIASRIVVSGELAEGARIAADFEKAQADSVFLVAETRIARGARPFFPQGLPVYTTSYTVDPRAGPLENLDLDGVRFMEMPWFVEADHPAVMAYEKPAELLPIDFERLYALGIDAWRLATAVAKSKAGAKAAFEPLDGVTGRITLEGKQFTRSLLPAELRDGRVVARLLD